ncbi:unnamed protein product [Lota lota]
MLGFIPSIPDAPFPASTRPFPPAARQFPYLLAASTNDSLQSPSNRWLHRFPPRPSYSKYLKTIGIDYLERSPSLIQNQTVVLILGLLYPAQRHEQTSIDPAALVLQAVDRPGERLAEVVGEAGKECVV